MKPKEEQREVSTFDYTLAEQRFDGTILITDPCYIIHGMDDQDCDWMTLVSRLCLSPFMQSSTYYGDWGCTVYNVTNRLTKRNVKKNTLGKFCADAGLVCVCDYKQLIKKNRKFKKWCEEHPWCCCVIKNFHGIVKFNLYNDSYWYEGKLCTDKSLHVEGEGTVNRKRFLFKSFQTSL